MLRRLLNKGGGCKSSTGFQISFRQPFAQLIKKKPFKWLPLTTVDGKVGLSSGGKRNRSSGWGAAMCQGGSCGLSCTYLFHKWSKCEDFSHSVLISRMSTQLMGSNLKRFALRQKMALVTQVLSALGFLQTMYELLWHLLSWSDKSNHRSVALTSAWMIHHLNTGIKADEQSKINTGERVCPALAHVYALNSGDCLGLYETGGVGGRGVGAI